MIGFIDAIKKFYANYANFSGRATRAEYWWVALYLVILYCIPYTFLVGYAMEGETSIFWSTLLGLIALANLIPSLALTWRRLHDVGKGGGWYFISLVPLVGGIWLLVLTLEASQPFPNRFGPDPQACPPEFPQ